MVACSSPNPPSKSTDTSEYEPEVPDDGVFYQVHCTNRGNYHTGYFGGVNYVFPTKHEIGVYSGCALLYTSLADPDDIDRMQLACADNCEIKQHFNTANSDKQYLCDPENFVAFETHWNVCMRKKDDMDLAPVTNALGIAASTAVGTLPCELQGGCVGLFTLGVEAALWTPGGVSLGESASEHVAPVTSADGEFTAPGLSPVNVSLTGQAAFTASACGQDACPIFLGDLDVFGPAFAPTAVGIKYPDNSTASKVITNLEAHLSESTLGIWLPNTGGAVIFPPNGLVLETEFDVSGPTNVLGENGHQHIRMQLDDYVFGTVSGGTLHVDLTLSTAFGSVVVDATFVDP